MTERTGSERHRPLASLTLPGSSSSARTARHLLRDELAGRLPPAVLDDLLELVSELVSNAAAATSGLLRLTVTCDDDMLRVELIDGSEVLPQLDDRGPLAESGRGLWLVDALALAWGAAPQPIGKMVWFTLRVNTQGSLGLLTDQVGHQGYGIEQSLNELVAVNDVAPAVAGNDAVAGVDGCFHTHASRIRPDGSQNEHLSIVGATPLSPSLELTLIEGRWLTDTDYRPVVIHTHSADEGDPEVGDIVVLEIERHERTWNIVGASTPTIVGPVTYLPVQAPTNATGLPDQANLLAVQLHPGADPVDIADRLDPPPARPAPLSAPRDGSPEQPRHRSGPQRVLRVRRGRLGARRARHQWPRATRPARVAARLTVRDTLAYK